MPDKNKVIITTFTDPMMGLSYECEPIFRKLETHFADKIDFRYRMGLLVRDVYELVEPQDMKIGKEFAIKKYNERLAKIYESEEAITGMPINMTDLHLFDTDHTSSLNLNLAYKAAEIISPQKADLFLYNLRYATIVLCRPTTHIEEISKVAKETGIDTEIFMNCFNGKEAQTALEQDLRIARALQIHSLPTYYIQYNDKTVVIRSLIGYNAFTRTIYEITDGELTPKAVNQSLKELQGFLDKHPLISPIEICEAFDFDSTDTVMKFIEPLLQSGEIELKNVYHGQFIVKRNGGF